MMKGFAEDLTRFVLLWSVVRACSAKSGDSVPEQPVPTFTARLWGPRAFRAPSMLRRIGRHHQSVADDSANWWPEEITRRLFGLLRLPLAGG